MVLEKIAATHVAQTEAGYAAYLQQVLASLPLAEDEIQEEMEERERDGNCCLFVFALVCKGWRKAQLKVGGPLRTRVKSDVILPGRVALAKWALAEGCPREAENGFTMAASAAQYGHMELVRWLIQEQGFAMDLTVMGCAARGGNLELVRWLRAEGCPWDTNRLLMGASMHGQLEVLRWARENGCDWNASACAGAASNGQREVLQWLRAEGCPWDGHTCDLAVQGGHVETLRWARENGAWWNVATRDQAAAELGYTDDLGNWDWV